MKFLYIGVYCNLISVQISMLVLDITFYIFLYITYIFSCSYFNENLLLLHQEVCLVIRMKCRKKISNLGESLLTASAIAEINPELNAKSRIKISNNVYYKE